MRVRARTESKHGTSEDVDDAPAGRPSAEVQDLRGRPLPVLYMPLLGILVIVAAVFGLMVDDAYRLVSQLTRATWRAMDVVTLATMPALFWATWRARAGSLAAHLVSVGILTWLTYGYAHLSIGAPLNAMFLIYLSVLTLAGFAMLDGLLRVDVVAASPKSCRV